MTKEVIIIDNVLPKGYLDDIETVLKRGSLNWEFDASSVYGHRTESTTVWDKQMVHPVSQMGKIQSDKWNRFAPMLYIIEEKLAKKIKGIERMKFNMTFTTPNDFENTSYHWDGLSDGIRRFSVVLYIDESDGNTVITDLHTSAKSHSENTYETVLSNIESLQKNGNVLADVEYRRNRLVCFDSSLLHRSTPPKKHACRTVMNLVFQE